MYRFYKLAWLLRAIFYKLVFGSFAMPGYLGQPIFLLNTRCMHVGSRVRIFPGLRAECHGEGKLIIHDNVSIGQGFHVICGAELHIGEGCLISGNVFITDTDHSYSDTLRPVFDQPCIINRTNIAENCFIGIGARIQAGTSLGRGCVVGANAVVRGIFPEHSVIAGAPARIVKRYNSESGQWERAPASS